MAASSNKGKFVVAKQDKFATVGGGLGSRPKVYESMQAAQHDINSNPKLKGAAVRPYTGDGAAGATVAQATTSKAKAKAGTAQPAKPKRAVAGK